VEQFSEYPLVVMPNVPVSVSPKVSQRHVFSQLETVIAYYDWAPCKIKDCAKGGTDEKEKHSFSLRSKNVSRRQNQERRE